MSEHVITASFVNGGDKPTPKQRKFVMEVLRVASESQQLQLAKKELPNHEPDTEAYRALAEKIEELEVKVKNNDKFFFAGGAIRGGKTIMCLAILCILCKLYPRSRWHIIRKSNKNLQSTVLKSLEALLANTEGLYWKRSDKEYFVQFKNGSRIYMTSEAYDRDKQLTKFLGLELNGVLFEQLEELREETYTRVMTRLGSFYGVKGPMPPIIMLSTFNPTYNWLKTAIHDKWKKGKLDPGYYYMELLPRDNPYVTQDQWEMWKNLPDDEYQRMIEGIWDIKVKHQFCYAFDPKRNISPIPLAIDWRYDVWLSFDFNVDPMTCILAQTDYESFIRVIREFRIENGDTYMMCEAIKPFIKGYEASVRVTGDATGKNRMAGTRGHINHYQIIKEELGLGNTQFKVPSVNPLISDSRVFVNALLQKLPEFVFDETCEETIKDVRFVVIDMDREGNVAIKKTGSNEVLTVDNKTLGHLLDCVRYLTSATFTNWLKIPKS